MISTYSGLNEGNTQVRSMAALWRLSTTKKVLYYLLAVFVFFIWYQVFVNLMYEGSVTGDFEAINILKSLGFGYIPILCLFLINSGFVFFVTPGILQRIHGGPFVKILLDFVLSWFAVLAVNIGFIGLGYAFGKSPQVMWIPTFVINILVYTINEAFYFISSYSRSERELEREHRIAAQLEYNILQSQVNPHFLFNSLNILYSLSYIDVDKSREFILALSRTYRYIMAHHHSRSVTVEEEKEFLSSYIEVLKTLYGSSLNVEIEDMSSGVSDRRLVPYSLQLLLENVIKHNIICEETPMTVEIVLDSDSVTVSNPIRPKNKPIENDSSGLGMKYLKELYMLNGGICNVSDEDGIFKVSLSYLDKR